ncbi:hypothetical protein [Micromonospora sp. NPDC005710]|uniref:hypothetical protein n=1 Tax=Micromonospora sp. NPDC005710 TaxID=3157051 RepID=UPI0033FA0322
MTMFWLWTAVGGLALLLVVTLAVVVVRRRRVADTSLTHDAVLRNAQRAMVEMQNHRRRSDKGTIRGKGGGGDPKTMYDTAYGSDTSAGA